MLYPCVRLLTDTDIQASPLVADVNDRLVALQLLAWKFQSHGIVRAVGTHGPRVPLVLENMVGFYGSPVVHALNPEGYS